MNEPKMTECIIYGWVEMFGAKVGASFKLGAFAPGKEMTYSEIIAHTPQEQLDNFCMETLPEKFRFTGGGPLFHVLTPAEYEAEFGDDEDDEPDEDDPDESGFFGPEEPNERGR